MKKIITLTFITLMPILTLKATAISEEETIKPSVPCYEGTICYENMIKKLEEGNSLRVNWTEQLIHTSFIFCSSSDPAIYCNLCPKEYQNFVTHEKLCINTNNSLLMK